MPCLVHCQETQVDTVLNATRAHSPTQAVLHLAETTQGLHVLLVTEAICPMSAATKECH